MYLTAINGLAALGDVFPVQIIPRMMAEFLCVKHDSGLCSQTASSTFFSPQ